MKTIRVILLGTILAAASAAVQAQDALPALAQLDDQELRDLDNAQLRVLRAAVRGCQTPNAGRVIRPERDPCVIMETDRAIEQSGDELLADFHWMLRDRERYDENRTSTNWRAYLMRH